MRPPKPAVPKPQFNNGGASKPAPLLPSPGFGAKKQIPIFDKKSVGGAEVRDDGAPGDGSGVARGRGGGSSAPLNLIRDQPSVRDASPSSSTSPAKTKSKQPPPPLPARDDIGGEISSDADFGQSATETRSSNPSRQEDNVVSGRRGVDNMLSGRKENC